MRDALHRCDPPCIPYLGLYLTDLSFIEEGTPNFTEEGLLNFSKMRMVRDSMPLPLASPCPFYYVYTESLPHFDLRTETSFKE